MKKFFLRTTASQDAVKTSKLKEKIHKLNERRELNSNKFVMTNLLLSFFFPFFIVALAEITQDDSINSFILFLAQKPTIMLFNVIFATLLYAMLNFLLKKTWRAVLVEGLIYIVISYVEYFKFGTNGNHFLFSEIEMVRNIKGLGSFANITISATSILYAILFLTYLGAVFWFNPEIKIKRSRRIAGATSFFAVIASFLAFPGISTPVYSFFEVDTTVSANSFMLNDKFENNSFLAFFTQSVSDGIADKFLEPENYSEEIVESYLETPKTEKNESFVKPNVIVVMSEAFADFRIFDELELDDSKAYKLFDDVAAEGYKGTAIVPTFASYTVRTEFELIFGLPVKSLNDPNMPQLVLLDRKQPTIVDYYNEMGYSTAYLHPFLGFFYGRDKIYQNFGFDKLMFEDDLTVSADYHGTYIDDKTIFNQINSMIKENDKPLYIHTTTMQNHQPYEIGEDPTDELTNYLNGVSMTSEALRDFTNELKKTDEPTLVFIIGDHFPSLKNEGSVYNKLGLNGSNCSVLYEQGFVLWDNFGLNYSEIPDFNFSSYYMPYVLWDLIGAPKDSFMQTMLDKLEDVPVYSTQYAPNSPNDDELDILTYDRIFGDIISDDN